MKIQLLSESLANKIAAGEVVERPASVVKELVENSIDAKSSLIQVKVEEAGLKKIRIVDNGDGMSEVDCKRAFLRHATSKIKYDSDLFHIRSLGFRGEALASIASVSRMTLISSEGNGPSTRLDLEAGNIIREGKADARKGTEIIVSDLFFNTPARLKYIRSIHTELGHITDLVNRYALAYPEIRFELFHNDKLLFKTSGSGNKLQVISQIYGIEVAKQTLQTKKTSLDFEIESYVVRPEINRSNRKFLTLIVNGRYVKNYTLHQAIIDGYDNLLPIHRYPIAIVYIKLDPILLDVNVHPTKLEVRFSKEKELAKLIEASIREIWKKESLIPTVERRQKSKKQVEQAAFSLHLPSKQEKPPTAWNESEERETKQAEVFDDQLEHYVASEQVKETSIGQIDEGKHFEEEGKILKQSPLSSDVADLVSDHKQERIPPLYPIGQLQGTYILAQNDLGFYMIDQHAAQERIKYEYYRKQLGQPAKEVQELLLPLPFEFTLEESLRLKEFEAVLSAVGIQFEHFGGQTYTVRSHPNWFPKGEEEELIREIVDQVIEHEAIHIDKLREELAILMACKRSIKANHHLSLEEMERLIDDLRKAEDPFTCPHGRPVIIFQSYYEIEKMFKRIM